MWALHWKVWHFTTFSCVWYVSLKSSLARGLCFVVWCGFSNCIGEAVLERFFVKFHSAELTHTDDLWKISKIPHSTVRSAHIGKFSNIVIFPKQIQSFLIGNFLSIWPTHKEFFPYMRIFRKINPLWYESFEKPYEGFSWAPPTKYVYFTKIDLSFLLFLYNLSKFSRGYAPNPKYIQSKMALAPHKHGGGLRVLTNTVNTRLFLNWSKQLSIYVHICNTFG